MTCYDPETVAEALKERFAAATIGPFRVEYINDAGPYSDVESEHLALLERGDNVTDVVDIDGKYFASLVRHYGADGEPERW